MGQYIQHSVVLVQHYSAEWTVTQRLRAVRAVTIRSLHVCSLNWLSMSTPHTRGFNASLTASIKIHLTLLAASYKVRYLAYHRTATSGRAYSVC